MRVLAIDVGKKTGYTVQSKKGVEEVGSFLFSTLDKYRVNIKEIIKNRRPDLVVYSDTVFMRNANSVKPLHFYMCCVELACEEMKVQYEAIQDASAKKAVIGKGNAKKHEIKEWAFKKYNLPDTIGQDECDSLMFAQYIINKIK